MPKAIITALTPIHVGSGRKLLRNFDFVIDGEQVGFIDLNKLVGIIGIENIQQLTTAIEGRNSIVDFLKKGRGLTKLNISEYCNIIGKNNSNNSTANELKEHYRTALKGVCIPGSSIKGTIKTAVWESLASKIAQQEWSVSDYGKVRNDRIDKFSDSGIDKKLFGGNANEKSTRFLRVGDAHFNNTSTAIFEIGIYNKGYNDWNFKQGQSFLAECIPPGSIGGFEISIPQALMHKNLEKNPDIWSRINMGYLTGGIPVLFNNLNTYLSRQLEFEINDLEDAGFHDELEGEEMLKYLDDIKNKVDLLISNNTQSEAIIRIGGNSGWNFMTGGWVKSATNIDDDWSYLRRTIQRKDYGDMELWPKTRKMTTKSFPLGFAKITLAN